MSGALQVEDEALGRRLDRSGDRVGAVAQLHVGPLDRQVEAPARLDAADVERPASSDDERVRRRLSAEGVERLGRGDADAAPLAGRVAPGPVVAAELVAVLVDDRPVGPPQALPLEEGAVVVSREEARLLALGALGHGEARRSSLGPRALLRLRAEREADAVEQLGIHGREHVGLVLLGIEAAGDQPAPAPLLDAGIVARPEDARPGPAGERDELVEAEAAVAPRARVRGQAGGVGLDEGAYHALTERLPQVERHVRQPEGVAGAARCDDRVRGAADAVGARAGRVEPQPQGDADGLRPGAQERDCAVDAAAHRDGDPARDRPGLEGRGERVREGVGRQRLPRDRRCLEQRQPGEVAGEAARVGLHDAVAVHDEPDGGVVGTAGGVSDQLVQGHRLRLAASRRPSCGRATPAGSPTPGATSQRPPGAPPVP